jgi:hypothetical protein
VFRWLHECDLLLGSTTRIAIAESSADVLKAERDLQPRSNRAMAIRVRTAVGVLQRALAVDTDDAYRGLRGGDHLAPGSGRSRAPPAETMTKCRPLFADRYVIDADCARPASPFHSSLPVWTSSAQIVVLGASIEAKPQAVSSARRSSACPTAAAGLDAERTGVFDAVISRRVPAAQ